jgi:hypothetical protein
MADQTRPSAATRDAEQREAAVAHAVGEEPTPDEERAADAHGAVDPSVVEHEQEMNERGANAKGEGRVD